MLRVKGRHGLISPTRTPPVIEREGDRRRRRRRRRRRKEGKRKGQACITITTNNLYHYYTLSHLYDHHPKPWPPHYHPNPPVWEGKVHGGRSCGHDVGSHEGPSNQVMGEYPVGKSSLHHLL